MSITDSAARTHEHRGRTPVSGTAPFGRPHLRSVRESTVQLTDSVGVIAPTAFVGESTMAWIRSLGYEADRLDVHGLGARTVLPRVLLVQGAQTLARLPVEALRRMRVIVLNDAADSATVMSGARMIPNTSTAPDQVCAAIAQVLGGPVSARVPMSSREQEVLATYVLGETVKETAAVHFIAECTVRTHYRRVTRRYEDAGRPVSNKAQLLLAMVADGRLRLDGSLGAVADA